VKKVQVLGTGCPKCRTLFENAEAACNDSSAEFELEKIDDINRIIEFGIVTTPALLIDGEVKAVGKVLSKEEIRELL
jgi:small redox-active disulfide protein 2